MHTDDELIRLVDHINETVLSGHKDIKGKAKYLSERALDCGIRLAESELKNKFFGPFSKRKPIYLSKASIINLDKFLRNIKDEFSINIEIISAFKNKFILDEVREQSNQREGVADILNVLFKNKPRLEYLENTEWVFYERIGDDVIKNADWGIAVGRINFNSYKSYLNVTMNTRYEFINRSYQGIATQDAQKCLFIDLLKKEDNTRSNLILQLADSDAQAQTILIGHYSFYSPSNAYDHILSKTIVLQKVKDLVDKNNRREYLPIGNYNHSSSEYLEIPLEIRRFLYHRQKNRLSMPKEAVSDLNELNKFLKNHRFKKINTILNDYFLNEYTVYYQRSDGSIVEDFLKIEVDDEAVELKATYSHKPDVNKKYNKTWIGQIFMHGLNSVSLELSNEKRKNRDEQEDPILLTFWLPDESLTFHESECYPGIIAGLEDSVKGPISLVCLVTKKNIPDFLGGNDLRVKNFFDLQDATILRPKNRHFQLNSFL